LSTSPVRLCDAGVGGMQRKSPSDDTKSIWIEPRVAFSHVNDEGRPNGLRMDEFRRETGNRQHARKGELK